MLHVYTSGRFKAAINLQSKAAPGFNPGAPWLLLFKDGRVRRFGSQRRAKEEATTLWAPVKFSRA